MEKEKTSTSVLVCRYSLLSLSLGLYFVLNWYDAAIYAFLGYMFFTDWAWETIIHYKS
jgi:hypothetical protein